MKTFASNLKVSFKDMSTNTMKMLTKPCLMVLHGDDSQANTMVEIYRSLCLFYDIKFIKVITNYEDSSVQPFIPNRFFKLHISSLIHEASWIRRCSDFVSSFVFIFLLGHLEKSWENVITRTLLKNIKQSDKIMIFSNKPMFTEFMQYNMKDHRWSHQPVRLLAGLVINAVISIQHLHTLLLQKENICLKVLLPVCTDIYTTLDPHTIDLDAFLFQNV